MTDKEQLEMWMQTFDSVPEEEKQYRWFEISCLANEALDKGTITSSFACEIEEWLFSWDDPVTDDDEYCDH